MSTTPPKPPMTPYRYAWYTIVGLTVWKVWIGSVEPAGVARAQIPDPAAQRLRLLEEVRRTNTLLAGIDDAIRHRTIKVEVVGADNTRAVKSPKPGR